MSTNSIVFHPGHRRFVTATDSEVKIFQKLTSGDALLLKRSIKFNERLVFLKSGSQTDEFVLLTSESNELDSKKLVQVYNWLSGDLVSNHPFPDGLMWPQSLAMSQDGALIAASGFEEELLICDRSGATHKTPNWQQSEDGAALSLLTGISIHPNNRMIIYGATDQGGGDICLLEQKDQRFSTIEYGLDRGDIAKRHGDLADALVATAIRADGKVFAVYEYYPLCNRDDPVQGAILMYETATRKLLWSELIEIDCVSTIPDREYFCPDSAVTFSESGRQVYLGSIHGKILAWEVETGAKLPPLVSSYSHFMHKFVLVGGEPEIWVADNEGKPVRV